MLFILFCFCSFCFAFEEGLYCYNLLEELLLHPKDIRLVVFLFSFVSMYFFDFLFDFLVEPIGWLVAFCLASICFFFPDFLAVDFHFHIIVVRKVARYDTKPLKFIETCFMA